ncbi:chaperonin 10-like protein [Lophiotrema nucula]|uniref:alcohol dehydrogenase (NADP(+)) n=1 Tax=Lophiotrema nucula TaxID=690887 RepID=A0A6A5YGX6_9PLEO|nr:chaperonin 10-like protein [Lophiotrema nucula]
MTSQDKFEGWVAQDASAIEGKMQWTTYEPKPFEETDIEMEVSHCGICGSDLHTLRSGWGPSDYPLVVGHEIIGRATRVGKDVEDIKIGDRVGIGAQSGSCLHCKRCDNGLEPHCSNKSTNTYNDTWPNGGKSYGGYAKRWRGSGAFAFKIPDEIPSETAAPLLCGGLTVYSPLVQNGAGPGKRVGIVGLGGLGHFAVLFAKALKCDKVVVISRSSSKKADALKMGADDFIATDEDPDWATKNADSLDLLISTISASFAIEQYLTLLDVKGTLIQVGAPEDTLPPLHAFQLIFKRLKLGGSLIGGRQEAKDMLQLAAKSKLKAWTQVVPMKDANKAIVDMEKGKARYRYVLTN